MCTNRKAKRHRRKVVGEKVSPSTNTSTKAVRHIYAKREWERVVAVLMAVAVVTQIQMVCDERVSSTGTDDAGSDQ